MKNNNNNNNERKFFFWCITDWATAQLYCEKKNCIAMLKLYCKKQGRRLWDCIARWVKLA